VKLLCFIEGTPSVKRCKVHITDKVSLVVEAAQKLHGSTLLPIYQGRRLNPEKTFWEEQVLDNAKILMNGVRGLMTL